MDSPVKQIRSFVQKDRPITWNLATMRLRYTEYQRKMKALKARAERARRGEGAASESD